MNQTLTIEEISFLVARKLARNGIRWLNQNAPLGWHRNLFEPLSDGTFYYRPYASDNTCSVPALAFEYDRRFIDSCGHVNQVLISRHFGLLPQDNFRLGFDCGVRSSRGKVILDITTEQQAKAWIIEILVSNFGSLPHRHQTDESIVRFASLKAGWVRPENPSLWDKIRRRFQLVFG